MGIFGPKFGKAIDLIHDFFGIETHTMRVASQATLETIRALEEPKVQLHTALAALIEDFWSTNQIKIKHLLYRQSWSSIQNMYDDVIEGLLSDILKDRAEELHKSHDLRVIDIYDFVTDFMKAWYIEQKKNGVPNIDKLYASRRDPLYLICSGLNTSLFSIIKTLDVYQRLGGKMQKETIYLSTKEYLVTMSSSHTELFISLDVMSVQGYTTLSEMFAIDSDVFDEQASGRRSYDEQNFFLDEQGILQFDEGFYIPELCQENVTNMLESVTEPRVKCPALFAKAVNGTKSGKVNVIRDMHELLIDWYLDVYMCKKGY